MPPVNVDPAKVREFADAESFHRWLAENHDRADEVWIRIFKKGSGLASITPVEAIDACLCWGWIDAIRKGLDEVSFLQRYTPRGRKSAWSRINVDNVARLIEEGRMTVHGLAHVEAARADGRWQKAYSVSKDEMPVDLVAAIEAVPAAKAMLGKLTAQNRFAMIYRLGALKTEAARQRNIEKFVAMLARGETIHPQKPS